MLSFVQLTHARKVISAEIIMCKFVAIHNISNNGSFVPPDESDVPRFSYFACRHTKTKSIVCDALDPHYKKPLVENAPLITPVMNLMIEGTW